MGVAENISATEWPEQGTMLGLRAEVCFRYDTSRLFLGTIVRDDTEAPFVGLIRLDDGRHVLKSECQFSPILGAKDGRFRLPFGSTRGQDT